MSQQIALANPRTISARTRQSVEREDRLRVEALAEANKRGGTVTDIVNNAEHYYRFLTGGTP